MSELIARAPRHDLRPLRGRDPDEPHRVSSPLELLFDLSFAVAFGIGGSNAADLLGQGRPGPAFAGFAFAAFAIVWAWINYSWFASAYDNDDWASRLVAMSMMIGVVITALGMNPMFDSLTSGGTFTIRTVVLGYVVMRLSLLLGWVRAWRSDPARRRSIMRYIVSLVAVQAAWILAAVSLQLSATPALVLGFSLMALELVGPWTAERAGGGTPWHPHHIAERYSLLVIITLGEGVIGTVATLSAVVGHDNWSLAAGLVVVSGIGLTFGLWWVYFTLQPREVLAQHRNHSFLFGYLHIPLFASIAGVGAGLQVAGDWIAGNSTLDQFWVVACVAVPVATYLTLYYLLTYLMLPGARTGHRFHALLWLLTLTVIALALGLAALGVAMGWCLLVVMLAPLVTVIGYESFGYRHLDRALHECLDR